MVKVARTYPNEDIVGILSRQLTWSHLIELTEVPDPTKRLFYHQMSIVNHWSVRQLRDQEDAMVYERTLIAAKSEEEQVQDLAAATEGEITPDLVLRNSYVVDFLGLEGAYSESDLEDAVVEQLEKFIMELGAGLRLPEASEKDPRRFYRLQTRSTLLSPPPSPTFSD